MIKTDSVVDFLRKNGPKEFEEIWIDIHPKLITQLLKNFDDSKLRADLLISMSKDERLVIFPKEGKDIWDLRENYSFQSYKELKEKALGEELKKIENDVEEDLE